MKIIASLVAVFALTGCGSGLNQVVWGLNDAAAEMMGVYSAPTLASAPTPSGCNDRRCRTLDEIEAKGYELARQGKITWVKLVDVFYKKRAELYPSSQDGFGVSELVAYQRLLAEQLDLGKITETDWAYLIEVKRSEISARNQSVRGSAPRRVECTTINAGTTSFPLYRTVCN